MAPSKTLLFVLYGIAVLLRARLPLGREADWTDMVINSAGAPICAPLKFFRHVLPIIRHHHEKMERSPAILPPQIYGYRPAMIQVISEVARGLIGTSPSRLHALQC